MIKKMKFQKAVGPMIFFVIMFFIAYSTAFAVPINPFNDRPVSVSPSGDIPISPFPDANLQTILNYMFGPGVDVIAGQQGAGMWGISALPPTTMPTLAFEYASLAGQNTLGIWSDPDMVSSTPPNMRPILKGNATGYPFWTSAMLSWDISGNLWIWGDPTKVYTGGPFTGINPYSFGFYLENSGGNFYTVDQLNLGNAAQAIAFNKPGTDTWAIAFEDLPLASADRDYNDMVIKVESIKPVPEPGTLALLGSGLISIGIYRWRKMKK